MIIGVAREVKPGERRVALVPDIAGRLVKSGLDVHMESSAGASAGFCDEAYADVGVKVEPDPAALLRQADILLTVQRPERDRLDLLKPGAIVIGFLDPLGDPGYVEQFAKRKLTAISMETIPRTTRAQAMDAISSQSNIAGYKAVLLAATHLPKFFPMLTTAAGTVPPAKVLVLGVGVAGLQAIATARRLGAVVTAYDPRAAVQEQIHSLGAQSLAIDLGESAEGEGGYARELSPEAIQRQRSLLVEPIGASDVVITTAQIPGRPAPLLVTTDAVQAMKAGSVIVDLAADSGGNCELTEAEKTVVKFGVTLIGASNLASTVPLHASQLYARNVQSLLALIVKDGVVSLDFQDEIVRGACLTHDGEIMHEATRRALGIGK